VNRLFVNSGQIRLLVLRSSRPPSSIPLLILVRGRVRDEPGGKVSFLFRNEMEGLMYFPQHTDDGGRGRGQTAGANLMKKEGRAAVSNLMMGSGRRCGLILDVTMG
jgi:hypothetical protein